LVSHFSNTAGGFYTQEIREDGVRKGFEIVTIDNQRAILAHVDIRGPHHVGKYGVDLQALENLGVCAIRKAEATHALVIIDEIGPMEILSKAFRQAVLEILSGEATVLGSIARRSDPFIEQVKALPGVRLVEIHPTNREAIFDRLLAQLQKVGFLNNNLS
jgi:nucleoside-triphosphatase